MNEDAVFMELAIEQALKATADVPVGCVVVLAGTVVASGFNQREVNNDPTAHAEIIAIRQAAHLRGNWRLEGATLYCTLEPCPMCAEAIRQARVQRLVFGAYDGVSGAAGSAFNLFEKGRGLPVPEVIGGILEERCRTLLLHFFQGRRTCEVDSK